MLLSSGSLLSLLLLAEIKFFAIVESIIIIIISVIFINVSRPDATTNVRHSVDFVGLLLNKGTDVSYLDAAANA